MTAMKRNPSPVTAARSEKKEAVSPLALTEKERTALRRGALAAMKRHGFKTPEEYIEYIDSKRGY